MTLIGAEVISIIIASGVVIIVVLAMSILDYCKGNHMMLRALLKRQGLEALEISKILRGED